MEGQTRSFTPEEISEIVNETVEETVKEMQSVADIVRLVALVTMELKDLLSLAADVEIVGTRGLSREKSLAWKAAVTLKERHA